MPFTEATGGIAILLQDLGDCRGLWRYGTVIGGKAVGNFCNATHVHTVMITARQQRCTGWRTQCRRMKLVVLEACLGHFVDTRSGYRPTKSTAGAEAHIIEHNQQDIR